MMTCPSGKITFESKLEANARILALWKKRKPGQRMERQAYQCRECGEWHLTSQGRRGRFYV